MRILSYLIRNQKYEKINKIFNIWWKRRKIG